MPRYAHLEKRYSTAIADGLKDNLAFRAWVLCQTKFASFPEAKLLDAEMWSKRTRSAESWWGSHFQYPGCDCFGCKGGKETDLLAIFEVPALRFALHFEVKHPGDKFDPKRKQPEAYRARAECWVKKAPNTILTHQDTAIVLICSPSRLQGFDTHSASFDHVIPLERIAEAFPGLTPS